MKAEDVQVDTQNKPKTKNFGIWLLLFKIVTKLSKISAKIYKIALAGASFAAYTYIFTWKFALIILAQLVIHEYGHIWAMKKCGIKTKGIYLIPFFGGAAVASESFKTRWDEVFVALMGPVFGFLCALAMLILYYITTDPMYAAASSWMAMINIFNLLPINPLDGGRVMKSIAFSLNSWAGIIYMIMGIAIASFLAFWAGIYLLLLMAAVSALELVLEWHLMKRFPQYVQEIKPHYSSLGLTQASFTGVPTLTVKGITISAIFYVSMILILFLLMNLTSHIPGANLAMEMLTD